jgi:hypothetical protein
LIIPLVLMRFGFSSGCFKAVEVGFFPCECEQFFGAVCERERV